MRRLKVRGPSKPVRAEIKISGSKSISNRALIIQNLCTESFSIDNLSDSDDTHVLQKALATITAPSIDVHHAGTSFRFLCALLAINAHDQVLTGSARMKERPIGPLVAALREIGCRIDYLENEGFPPLRIQAFEKQQATEIRLRADISSQFISALCMIAPKLEKGLVIHLEGEQVSRPYLDMTLEMMRGFGISVEETGSKISITHQDYKAGDYLVESDWSSASYHYGICSLIPGSRIGLNYFFKNSMQGDSEIVKIAEAFGVRTRYASDGIVLEESGRVLHHYEYDFIRQPDLFQTVAVMSAATGIPLNAKGLQTLAIKETNRVHALANELSKAGVQLEKSEYTAWDYQLSGEARVLNPEFESYNDHRMAMCLSLLACIAPVIIKDPSVVSKSYPRFWKDLQHIGFRIEELTQKKQD